MKLRQIHTSLQSLTQISGLAVILKLFILFGTLSFPVAARQIAAYESVRQTPVSSPVSMQPAQGIPFEDCQGLIFVQVSINGSRPHWFVLDTGATLSVINAERVTTFGLRPSVGGRVNVDGGTVPFQRVAGVSLRLASVETRVPSLMVISLSPLEPHAGRTVDGLLGSDFLSQFITQIDYEDRRIYLHNPQADPYSRSDEPISFTWDDHTPYIRAKVGMPDGRSIEGRFQIDTGAVRSLDLNRPFVQKNVNPSPPNTIEPVSSSSLGGEVSQRIGRVSSLQVGPWSSPQPITRFSSDETGSGARADYDGTIGAGFLRRFVVTIDYPRRQLILKPNARFSDPDEYDMSGLSVVASPPDFTIFRIAKSVLGTPGAAAGLRRGDVILAIDGRPAREFLLNEIEQMMKRAGAVYNFRIRRGRKTSNHKIILRRLI
jgi:hypothetical protein